MTPETKEIIEKEARLWSRTVMGVELSDVYEDPREVDAYIAGATRYAEKAEEKDKLFNDLLAENVKLLDDANYWKAVSDKLHKEFETDHRQLESKDQEISLLKEEYKGFRAAMARGDDLYANLRWDEELSPYQKLKVIAGKMKDALNGTDRLNDNSKDVREALTAYAEFCKEK